jgi:hypothetical protein
MSIFYIKLSQITILIFTLTLSCSYNEKKDSYVENENTIDSTDLNNNQEQVDEMKKHDNVWVFSTDGKYKLRIFEKAGQISGPFDEVLFGSRRYYCIEVSALENILSHIDFPRSKSTSPSPSQDNPVYLTLFIYDEEYVIYSYMGFDKLYSVKFAFNINTFEKFKDKVSIGISYTNGNTGGWHPDRLYYSKSTKDFNIKRPPLILFEIPNIHEILTPLDTTVYDKNAPLADEKWFKSNGLVLFTVHKRTTPPFRPTIPPLE